MIAKKDGLVSAVAPEAKLLPDSAGAVFDATPACLASLRALSGAPAPQRHDLVMAVLRDSIPPARAAHTTITVVELPGAPKPLRERLTNPRLSETVADHVAVALLLGGDGSGASLSPSVSGDLLFVVSPDLTMLARIDPADKRTAGRARMLSALSGAETLFKKGTPSAEDAVVVGNGGDDADGEGERLADALGDVGPGPAKKTPEERRREERIASLSTAQNAALFPTRSGAKVRFGDLTESSATVSVAPLHARGTFLDKRTSAPRFDAISSAYVDGGLYDRDTAAIISSLSRDPVNPIFVEEVTREDSSDDLNRKETLTVRYKDGSGRSGTVRIDLPVISRDGYMFQRGVKWHVTKQILAMPVIKVRPYEVLVTTAYNKATVERFGQNVSPASTYVRLLASQIEKERPKSVRVELASATAANAGSESTPEYDDIARAVRSIRTAKAGFIFSRPALDAELTKVAPWFSGSGEPGSHPVGWNDSGDAVYLILPDGSLSVARKGGSTLPVDTDKGLDHLIYEAVRDSAPGTDFALREPRPLDRKFTYSRVKMLSQYLPTAVIAGCMDGLVPMMKKAGIEFRVVDRQAFRRGAHPGMDSIVFKDAAVVYPSRRLRDTLLMNGLKEIDTEEYPMAEFEPFGMGWVDHIADRLGSPGHAKALVNFQMSFVDPMTREILQQRGLPTDTPGLLLYASSLLETNRYDEANDMRNYRIRGPELVNALLYRALHREMESVRRTRESAEPQRLNVRQDEVIRQVLSASNVEEVTELNPLLEAELRGKATWTGAAGGLGDGRTVNRAMRAYHPSMQGLFGFYSPDSSEIGVKRTMTFGASVADARGTIDPALSGTDAASNLALGELVSSFTAQHADPPRIGMQSKQGTHTLPIVHHTPLLVGSGAEKAVVHAVGNTFAHKAAMAGRVESVDEVAQLVRLAYDDGTVGVIDLSPRSVKNAGGGFYITSQLSLNPGIRKGAKFDAGQVLAHDPSFFAALPDGSTAYKSGKLARVAIAALDQTYEDSVMITEKLARETAALVTMSRAVSLGAQTNLQKVASVGDRVTPDAPLAVFENLTDDADVSALLGRVGKEFDQSIAELTRNVAAAKYSGEIVEMRVYYNKDLPLLSPSLQAFVKKQERAAGLRKKAAAGAPAAELVRINAPMRVTQDKVGGEPVDGVLIVFLIKILDVAAPGDKFTLQTALKGIVSKVFERGEEPTAEDGSQVDYIASPLSIVSRMTSDAFLQMWTNASLVGLKEKVLEIYRK
jgi:hypothetical protein